MYTELIVKDKNISSEDLRKFFFAGASLNTLCMPPSFINKFPELKEHLTFAALIDYPSGLSHTNIRAHEIVYAGRSGAKYADVVINNSHLEDTNYEAIVNDMEVCCAAAAQMKMDVRAILEYTLFPTDDVIKIADLLNQNTGISSIITSTGSLPQDSHDDIIICSKLLKITYLDIISCSCWTKKHLNLLKSINISGIRFSSIATLEGIITSNIEK